MKRDDQIRASLLVIALAASGCDQPATEASPSGSATARSMSASPPAGTTMASAPKTVQTPRWPTPTKVAEDQDRPIDVRVDADNIYWINEGRIRGDDEALGTAAVVKRAKAGGDISKIADGDDMITAFAVDDTSLVWASDKGVYRANKTGGKRKRLHRFEKGKGAPTILGVHKSRVYLGLAHMQNGGLYVIKPGEAKARPYTVGMFNVHAMAFDDGGLYACVGPQGKMMGYTPTDGEDEIRARSLGQCRGLAFHGGKLFWTESKAGKIGTMPASGGTRKALASGLGEPWRIAVRDGWVYWSDRKARTVSRVAEAGGKVDVIAKMTASPNGIAVGDAAVYWASPDDGCVYSVALPGAKKPVAPSASSSAVTSAAPTSTAKPSKATRSKPQPRRQAKTVRVPCPDESTPMCSRFHCTCDDGTQLTPPPGCEGAVLGYGEHGHAVWDCAVTQGDAMIGGPEDAP